MDFPPSRSAQEAALSAVNLQPAAAPSADSPTPEPSHAETLTNTHGLLILERTPDGLPSWLACKFCPLFGCRTRKRTYLMLYVAPFNLAKIEGHLAQEHPTEWEKFKNLDLEQKKQFFKGKTLPAPQKFRVRMEELKRSWFPTKSKKVSKRKRDKANNLDSGDSTRRPAKRLITEWAESSISLPLLSHEGDWVGRISFQPPVPQLNGQAISQPRRKLNILENLPPRKHAALPGKNVYQHLSAILQRYSEPFSRDLQQLVNQPLVRGLSEAQGDAMTPTWTESGKSSWAARTLFYLLRGIPADVTSTLLKEGTHDDQTEFVDAPEEPSSSKKPDTDLAGKKEEVRVTAKEEGVTMAEKAKDSESPDKPHLPDASEKPQDWLKFVSTTASCVGMTGLLALRRILSERQCWAFVITTRSCPVRKDAVEILIPVPTTTRPSTTAILIAPGGSDVPGSQADYSPPAPSARSTEIDVGNTTDVASAVQKELDIHASDLISLVFTVWLLLDESRSEPPKGHGEDMNAWVRGCVEMCLKCALAFLYECRGPARAKNDLRASVDYENIYTDWITATPNDDATIERARANYSLWSPKLRDSEWQAEKQVLRGLTICCHKAVAMTRGTNFSATLMYARAIVNKAVTNFETFMPVTITVPPLSLDPLHVVSIREGDNAVETAISLLDFVCPQWPTRLIGIRTGVRDNAAGKALEKALVNSLQARKMDELFLVDESIPVEKRPIYPSNLAAMTLDKFREFVCSYIKDTANLGERFIEKLESQHEALRLREAGNGELKKSWAEFEDLTELMIFVRGLELLWRREQGSDRDNECRFSGLVYDGDGCNTVDAEVEHVLRARTLMEIEQLEKLDQEGKRLLGTDVALKDCLIPWGENWSNLLLTAHGE